MDYYFRDFIPDDFTDVIGLWNQTGINSPKRGDTLEMIENTIASGGKLIIMALKPDEKIIGTSWITNDGRRLYLHHFGIIPPFQGKGLSIPLLKTSLDFARSLKMQIKLEVNRNDERVINLYKKAGFKDLGDYIVLIIRDWNDPGIL